MDYQLVLLAVCLFVIGTTSIAMIFYVLRFLLRNWRDIISIKAVWRNKYPSFEEFHALFDRGDLMLSAVIVASSLQLSHPKVSKILKAHSTYKTDYWRRVIRTTSFIYIMIRATSSERRAVTAWLRHLHRPIPLFEFETNVFVFATFAYGLVKTHEFMGHLSPEQSDGIVKGVMNMADKLDPKDKGRRISSTMTEVVKYLETELTFDIDELMRNHQEHTRLASVREEMKRQGIGKFLRMPWTLVKMTLLGAYVQRLAKNVLAQEPYTQSILRSPFWWFARRFHAFLSYFHCTMCPRMLTFDGTLDLLVTGNPRMENVPMKLYLEIFGSEGEGEG